MSWCDSSPLKGSANGEMDATSAEAHDALEGIYRWQRAGSHSLVAVHSIRWLKLSINSAAPV